ncbi:hypothetical protein Zmor_015554 [Zophobas morio]|uniref:Uncharacterized protein n=1 Tax=Zophobas morio TaxID=2755281 RepID=A0AA38MHA5_9CUCU|nr:hypothetical protein Zmor_015554 [Zophobas morio]
MESFINLLMCLFHLLLINEINEFIKKTNVPLLKMGAKYSSTDNKSKTSKSKHVDVVFKESGLLRNEFDTTSKINKILSTSLSEYIRRDLQNMKLKLFTESEKGQEGEEKKSTSSLDKLYDYLLKDCGLKERSVAKDVQVVDRTETLCLN